MKRVVIVGGGMTGLSAAHALSKKSREKSLEIVLFEKSSRLGGKIWTQQHGDFLLEAGPDSFLTTLPQAYDLCQELGLGGDLLATNKIQKDIFLLREGQLRRLPEGLNAMIPTKLWPFAATSLLSWPQKIRAGFDLVLPKKIDDRDESVEEFFCRRLGRGLFEALIEPFLAGVYAGRADELSVKSALPQIYEMEQKHRSLILAMTRQVNSRMKQSPSTQIARTMFMTLRNGLSALPQKLGESLGPGVIRREREVAFVIRRENGFKIGIHNGDQIDADAVLLAAPAQEAGRLIKTLDAALSGILESWPRTSSVVVTLVYRQEDMKHDLAGFGFLVPKTEGKYILGSTWTTTKFPGRLREGFAAIRFFLGGSGREAVVGQDDRAIFELVKKETRDLMGVAAEPQIQVLQRWIDGNPLYRVGHEVRWQKTQALARQYPGLFLAGASYGGVGIPNCIRQGQESAKNIEVFLRDRV